MGRKIKAGSRVSRRVMTKSPIRLNCQRKTRGAANRAAKELTGKPREGGYNAARRFDRVNKNRPEMYVSYDEPLADWERELLQTNESGQLKRTSTRTGTRAKVRWA